MNSLIATLDGYQWIGEAFQDDGWLVIPSEAARRLPGESGLWGIHSTVRIPIHAIAWIVDLSSGDDNDNDLQIVGSMTLNRPRG